MKEPVTVAFDSSDSLSRKHKRNKRQTLCRYKKIQPLIQSAFAKPCWQEAGKLDESKIKDLVSMGDRFPDKATVAIDVEGGGVVSGYRGHPGSVAVAGCIKPLGVRVIYFAII